MQVVDVFDPVGVHHFVGVVDLLYFLLLLDWFVVDHLFLHRAVEGFLGDAEAPQEEADDDEADDGEDDPGGNELHKQVFILNVALPSDALVWRGAGGTVRGALFAEIVGSVEEVKEGAGEDALAARWNGIVRTRWDADVSRKVEARRAGEAISA